MTNIYNWYMRIGNRVKLYTNGLQSVGNEYGHFLNSFQ